MLSPGRAARLESSGVRVRSSLIQSHVRKMDVEFASGDCVSENFNPKAPQHFLRAIAPGDAPLRRVAGQSINHILADTASPQCVFEIMPKGVKDFIGAGYTTVPDVAAKPFGPTFGCSALIGRHHRKQPSASTLNRSYTLHEIKEAKAHELGMNGHY